MKLCRLLLASFLSLASIGAFAQAADYTTDLPSVARVESEIKGSDPTDSLARQVAVFTYLQAYIDRIKYNRSYAGPYTPGETNALQAYRLAAYQISQDYAKSHTADEAKAFERLHGQYEMNSDFYADWSKRIIGPQTAAAYKNAESGLAATQQAHVAQEQKQYQQDVAAQQAANSGLSSDPTAVATRRCLELGGDSTACVGKGFATGFISLVTGGEGLGALTDPGITGLVLIGNYRSSGNLPTISFQSLNASIVNCGKLVADSRGYTIRKSGSSVQLMLNNKPIPITVTMHSDGSLAGPGLITVTGQIITGYEVVTHYVNGVASGTTRTPVYAPATDRCTIGTLAPPPPAQPAAASGPSSDAGFIGALTGMLGTIAPPDIDGLRMLGKYVSSGGLILDFAGDAVTMDCGQAHIKAPYTVVNSPASFTINVQNSGGPFNLSLTSSNTLQGSGSTTVNGRLVSGMNGDNVAFTPHSERCTVATFTPGTASSSMVTAQPQTVAAAGPAPASTTGLPTSPASKTSIKLNVTSTFPTATNPLAGKRVMLMTTTFDKVMSGMGAPIPAGTTPGQALQAFAYACNPPKDCSALGPKMAPYEVGAGNFDSTGKVVIAATLAPGTYYVFCSVAGTKGVLVWDLPATVKAGDNTISLTATNAELVLNSPAQ
jgi:hypothetical protein